MTTYQQKYGPWALVTGASSGIGAEFCRQLAAKGLNLIMVARRKERLDQLAEELTARHSVQARTIKADLSTPDFLAEIKPVTDNLEVGLLVNNAGFGIAGNFLDNPLERELELLYVNCRAPMIVTHDFGKRMAERKKGGIIVVSSLISFISSPVWLGYAASKAHNLFFGEALWGELREHGVDVEVLCPGFTKTEFHKVAGVKTRFAAMEVEPVVAKSLRKLGKKTTVITGLQNRLSYAFVRLMPRKFLTVLTGKALNTLKNL